MSKKKEGRVVIELKKKVIETCRAIYNEGLTGKKAGNVSVRVPNRDQMIITPSQLGHHRSQVEDLLVVDFDGKVVSGKRNPSSENRMHLAVYKARPDVGAIIHTHSVYASAVSANRMVIPPFIDEMVPFLGGSIEVAEYGMPGTDELAENAVKALGGKSAVLLANHGPLVTGKNLDRALEGAEIVEHIAKIYVSALSIGKPVLLPDEAVELQQSAYEFVKTMD
nr:class II aldolase/adducin family protein [Candidatus Njordarchaeum guaymaensis]